MTVSHPVTLARYYVILHAEVWYGTDQASGIVTDFEGPDSKHLAYVAAREMNHRRANQLVALDPPHTQSHV